MNDIYAEARTYFESEDEIALRFKLLEIFSGGSVFQFTNQTEPSNVQQLAIIYGGCPDRTKIKFIRSLNSAIKSCNPDDHPDFMSVAAELTTFAAEIGAFECIPAIDDLLLNFSNPEDKVHAVALRALIPDFASLCIGSPDAHVPFRRLADSSRWLEFLPSLMSACCFLDKSNAGFFLNEYLPIIFSADVPFDLFDIFLEIDHAAGQGVLFGQLQLVDPMILESLLNAMFDGDEPPYKLQIGTDPKELHFKVQDRPGFLACSKEWYSEGSNIEYHIPCENSPELFIQLSKRVDQSTGQTSADIVSLDSRRTSNGVG